MTFLVDTSVWSLALRKDSSSLEPTVHMLKEALLGADVVTTTGVVLQELLQGFSGPKSKLDIVERFAALPLIQPDRKDHIEAAEIRNLCRRAGIQIGTIDALIAQLCIRHEMQLLTADKDFTFAAAHCPLRIWSVLSPPKTDA